VVEEKMQVLVAVAVAEARLGGRRTVSKKLIATPTYKL
jgi:hypothetical protein